MEKVAIYIRVSKKEQSKNKGTDSSLNIQLKKCVEHCKKNNYKILKVYSDIESGSSDSRKHFNELFAAIPSKIYTKIIFWEISRIARKISTGMKFFEELDRYNISFDSISQPYIKDFMTLGIFLAWSAEDLRQMSLRIKSNLFEKTKEGYFVHGNPAQGYIRGENKMIVPDPKKAPIILKIFETYAQNYNLSETGRLFGKSRTDIVDIIDNRIYIGEVPYQKYTKDFDRKYRHRKHKNDIVWYKGLHEAIIPIELFEHCQKIRKSNIKARTSYENYKPALLFSGMVTCTCGAKMYQNKRNRTYKATGTKYTYYSYQCNKCKKNFSMIKLEKMIKEMILNSNELKDLNNIKGEEKNSLKEIKKLEKEMLLVEKERERVINLFQKGYIDEEELEVKFNEIDSRRKYIEERKSVYKIKINHPKEDDLENLEKLKFIINNYTEDDVLDARKIFKLLIEEIKIISFKPLHISIKFF